METWRLCCVSSVSLSLSLTHIFFFHLRSRCSFTAVNVVVMTAVQGWGICRELNYLLILSSSESWALRILERNESKPPTSQLPNPFLHRPRECLCIQYARSLFSVCLLSIALSLIHSAESNGEEQVDLRPTLLALCLTCEIQHPLRWCDTSLPSGACSSIIKLWWKLNLCHQLQPPAMWPKSAFLFSSCRSLESVTCLRKMFLLKDFFCNYFFPP